MGVLVKGQCGKKRLPTEAAANALLLEAQLRRALHGNQKRRESRAYYCHPCKAWHTTSKEYQR